MVSRQALADMYASVIIGRRSQCVYSFNHDSSILVFSNEVYWIKLGLISEVFSDLTHSLLSNLVSLHDCFP